MSDTVIISGKGRRENFYLTLDYSSLYQLTTATSQQQLQTVASTLPECHYRAFSRAQL